MDKETMLKKLTEKLEKMSKEELEQHLKNNGIKLEEEAQEEMKYSYDCNCPYCGWHNEDRYIQINSRIIKGMWYDTQRCTKCGKKFDKVYEMKYIRSQTTLSTTILLSNK